MPNIDNQALLASIQAVFECISRNEALLESETLDDATDTEELIMFYSDAMETLVGVYEEELENGANLPAIESLVFGKISERFK